VKKPPAGTAVLIGSFPIYHLGHHDLMKHALSRAASVIVVLGSAFHARTPRDPFTAEERIAMIRLALGEADGDRVRFAPVRDYYDDTRWANAVKAAVESMQADLPITLVLGTQDDTACYERCFPHWRQVQVQPHTELDGRKLRCRLIESGEDLGASVPRPVSQYLRGWLKGPHFRELAEDQAAIRKMMDEWSGAPYQPIFSTVDAVVTCRGHVLLVKRKGRPGPGLSALPGGFLDPKERLLDGAIRELREETGIPVEPSVLRRCLKRVVVFDHPARSMRGRTITHAHAFDLDEDRLPTVKGSDDAAAADWVPIEKLPAMEERFFEDHFHILDEFLHLTGL
jgi:bifunctional NMN adenylyltransferase/nudix hydrolase